MNRISEAVETVRKRLSNWPINASQYAAACELLAHEFIRLHDSYKPLEWKEEGEHPQLAVRRSLTTESCFGSIQVLEWDDGDVTVHLPRKKAQFCDSFKDGRNKAETWYRDRVASLMKPIYSDSDNHAK